MTKDEKNAISHRGKAFRKLKFFLTKDDKKQAKVEQIDAKK